MMLLEELIREGEAIRAEEIAEEYGRSRQRMNVYGIPAKVENPFGPEFDDTPQIDERQFAPIHG